MCGQIGGGRFSIQLTLPCSLNNVVVYIITFTYYFLESGWYCGSFRVIYCLTGSRKSVYVYQLTLMTR